MVKVCKSQPNIRKILQISPVKSIQGAQNFNEISVFNFHFFWRSIIAYIAQLQTFLNSVYETMDKGIHIHSTRNFPKQVSSNLLVLEKKIFLRKICFGFLVRNQCNELWVKIVFSCFKVIELYTKITLFNYKYWL